MKAALLILVALLLASCATTDIATVDSAVLLADARSRSESLCSTIKDGCEFSVSTSKDGWSVWVKPIFYAEDGTRVAPFDYDDMYFYDRRGRFIGSLRGL
jgi:hypothetical protein